ncbi:MAG: RES domain-containing protein [Bacteroidetes bacterium]|jgi:RES domain-containing protein|nr:RES domain-containing protein [Bacteroidota bacterium]
MLTLWRLEKERYVDEAFRGYGSLKTNGRWHHKGTQVAYASEHPAVAVLEKMVWLERYAAAQNSTFLFIPLHVPPGQIRTLDPEMLPEGWDEFPHLRATRDIGTRWFEQEESAVLAVPSAVLPMASNYLINPFHPEVHKTERGEPVPFTWDARLF